MQDVKPAYLISATAWQRGGGSDRNKVVRDLSPTEREFIRSGGVVYFRSSYLSGGKRGTNWRRAIEGSRGEFYPRVPEASVVLSLQAATGLN